MIFAFPETPDEAIKMLETKFNQLSKTPRHICILVEENKLGEFKEALKKQLGEFNCHLIGFQSSGFGEKRMLDSPQELMKRVMQTIKNKRLEERKESTKTISP